MSPDYRNLEVRPPDTDDEPWAIAEDPLAPARGCLLGIVIGGLAWLTVIIAVLYARYTP